MTGKLRRFRLRMSAVLTLVALFGSIACFAPTTHAAAPVSPQLFIECQNTMAVAVGTQHLAFTWGGEVWVTFDKLVDSHDGAFCGEIRNHSQLRLYSGGPSGNLGGWIDYGSTPAYSGQYHLDNSPRTPVPANNSGSTITYDNWGNWVAYSCGSVQAVYYLSNGSAYGSGTFYPNGYCVS